MLMPCPPLEAVCDYRRWLLQTLCSPLLITLVEFREFSSHLVSTSPLICAPSSSCLFQDFLFQPFSLIPSCSQPQSPPVYPGASSIYILCQGWLSVPSLNADIPSSWNLDMLLQSLRVHTHSTPVLLLLEDIVSLKSPITYVN